MQACCASSDHAACDRKLGWSGPARPARPSLNPPPATAPLPTPRHGAVHLNANRQVTGTLRGFDQFMNLVLDAAVDEKRKVDIGMVVIRGNSISTIEALEAVPRK